MNADSARENLERLQAAKLPRMDWRELATVKEGEKLPEADEKALSEYFAHFVKPGPCICCSAQQGAKDLLDAAMKARFRWGIVHGEGNCIECGWPARAYHRNVGPIEFLNMILQYHPDELSVPEKETA